MLCISEFKIVTTSLVTHDGYQKAVISYRSERAAHLFLSVSKGGKRIVASIPVAVGCGRGSLDVMLPLQKESFNAEWELSDKEGNTVAHTEALWKAPREWTLYVMISSHTDIGLHNSQYIQRANCSRFIDAAAKLCDLTEERDKNDRYRYTMEGTWFWNNYGMDRGKDAAERIVGDYIKKGKIGACAAVAGNHIQTYGLEEMCRSTYEKRLLEDNWGVKSETLSMIDNNGLPMSMIQVYADAGYKNIIFAPNQWNPIMSTVWKADRTKHKYIWNTSAGGGGSRIDLRLESELPMVFNWESDGGEQLTVWGCSHYSEAFGFYPNASSRPFSIKNKELLLTDLEENMYKRLELLEEKVPYDVWLLVCYWDDQEPDLYVTDQIMDWNAKWKWPKVRTLGDPNEPFELLRERHGDKIPVLRGDITGGWYQHPLSVPELMSRKFDADRRLPNAEKWSVAACLTDREYEYPSVEFRRAWDALLFNDEHSYGTSGYKGRSVYETWMQHRDWIEKAHGTAVSETERALRAIASHISATGDAVAVFNPTSRERVEYIEADEGQSYTTVTVPPFGYCTVKRELFRSVDEKRRRSNIPPCIENRYYRLCFSENGSIRSIFDKELSRELIDLSNEYRANEIVYTRDNHKSFTAPSAAEFEIVEKREKTEVTVKTRVEGLGAEIIQTVTLPSFEKRIEIDNSLLHVGDMINSKRYDRYIYFAFPFAVEGCRRFCHMNGAVAEYARDITGHGTDVYMAVNEWCCSENGEIGVALLMKDSHIVEFDRIHPDKTDFADAGDGSQIFVYAANDWLQKHVAGGSHLNYRFRYAITSYNGSYRTAGIPQMAELYVNPVETVEISKQEGSLPEGKYSFLSFKTDARFICLKRADDGNGLIARFYGEGETRFDSKLLAEPSSVDERKQNLTASKGFITYRLGRESIRSRVREPKKAKQNGRQLQIGSEYTGLISTPRAAAGDADGQLYLLWGANREPNFSHYKLYRSEASGFEPNAESFVADIMPEDYVVGRYEDVGLKSHTAYYYRVCAVNTDGVCGEMSDEFCGITREYIREIE